LIHVLSKNQKHILRKCKATEIMSKNKPLKSILSRKSGKNIIQIYAVFI
jgi:hypothetical protein